MIITPNLNPLELIYTRVALNKLKKDILLDNLSIIDSVLSELERALKEAERTENNKLMRNR